MEQTNVGDRIRHNIYGLGFVSSHSNFGQNAFFVAFDGRKDMLWIESSDFKKVS